MNFIINKYNKLMMPTQKWKLLVQNYGELEVFRELIKAHGVPTKIIPTPGMQVILDKYLSSAPRHIREQIILETDLENYPEHRRSHYRKLHRESSLFVHSLKSKDGANLRKVVFADKSEVYCSEVFDGTLGYIRKHTGTKFATSLDDIKIMLPSLPENSITLTFIGNWGESSECGFSILNGNNQEIGKTLGGLVNDYPAIAHIRLIGCYTGKINLGRGIRYESSRKAKVDDIRRWSDTYVTDDLALCPFAEESIGYHICQNIQGDRQVSISAAPGMCTYDVSQKAFFGVCDMKSITVTTRSGIKNKKRP